jgi:hypothetical protein
MRRIASSVLAASIWISLFSSASAQTLSAIPGLPFSTAGPVIRAHAESEKPFTVAGERGVLLGQ